MNAEQMAQVILDAYSANKEIRAYFEYFLDPDPDKLMEKANDVINKELNRSRRGYSKARISVIRKAIKTIADYRPGEEYVSRIMFDAIEAIVKHEQRQILPSSMYRGTEKLVWEYIVHANRNEMLSEAEIRLGELINSNIGRARFRSFVRTYADNAFASLKL